MARIFIWGAKHGGEQEVLEIGTVELDVYSHAVLSGGNGYHSFDEFKNSKNKERSGRSKLSLEAFSKENSCLA